MSDTPALIYLEADDEITSVIRRIRTAETDRVVVVAPGRSRATSSATALRLLARAAADAGRTVSVVGDSLTRSLAAEAGLGAYASVDDARAASPTDTGAATAPHAAIHVVRGPADDEATVAVALATQASDTETRAVRLPPAPPQRARRPARPVGQPRRGAIAVLVAAAALLLGGGYLVAAVLPAATIRITPRSETVGPVSYDIAIDNPVRTAGQVEDTATVTATGTYPIETAAAGTVILYNWTFAPVAVPAGTFVAAGEQAFATQADVVVPRGSLTTDGRIAAGDIAVAVLAAATGPDANVTAHAIDTVVDQGIDARLRGFPENPERRVDNPEATAGGASDTGVKITQDDVDAAIAELRQSLTDALTAALADTEDQIHADPAEPADPVFAGVDELVGTKDQETAEISGTLAYDRLSVAADDVRQQALDRFADEADALIPRGTELVPDTVAVRVGEISRNGDAISVAATVTGQATTQINRGQVLERAIGRSASDAEAALEPLGAATVELWPGWVSIVPDADWRIDIESTLAPDPSAAPSGS